jgi:hypothetical protein|tara:strand:+ start:3019 stop:3252 length:234 start_codon:yes stop_codon:yes gene_type:complete
MDKWEKQSSKHLVGKTIDEVRYMTNKEMEDMGWDQKPLVIFFTDNTFIYASADDEGNNGGALFTNFKDLETIPTQRN